MESATVELLTPEIVFRDHVPRVYNLAKRMLNNDADAEDVTQDVLLQVVRKLSTFRGEAAFTTWLHRVTVNAALAVRRKRNQRDEHRVHDPLENFTNDGQHAGHVRPWPRLPDDVALDQEQHEMIEQAIAQLPETYRDVFVLADVQELPNAEIGELLDLSVAAVKSRLHRARLMMREALSQHYEERLS